LIKEVGINNLVSSRGGGGLKEGSSEEKEIEIN